jgi:hypothetical protein
MFLRNVKWEIIKLHKISANNKTEMGVGITAVVVTDISDFKILVMFVTFDGEGFAKYISERQR